MAVLTVHPPVAEGAGQEVEAEMKWVCVVVCDVCDQLRDCSWVFCASQCSRPTSPSGKRSERASRFVTACGDVIAATNRIFFPGEIHLF